MKHHLFVAEDLCNVSVVREREKKRKRERQRKKDRENERFYHR